MLRSFIMFALIAFSESATDNTTSSTIYNKTQLFCGARLFVKQCASWHNFFDATNGQAWSRCADSRDSPCTACDGITCDDGEITKIDLSDSQLKGKIDISTFEAFSSSLTKLNLGFNSLEGDVDSIFTHNFEHLQDIDLSHNKLTGKVPASLAGMKALKKLNMEFNSIAGELPSELGQMETLTVLNLRGNKLSGPLPSSLAGLTNIRFLVLDFNQLDGQIPEMFSDMTSMRFLALGHNQFQGTVPATIADTGTWSLSLECNQLMGVVPDLDWAPMNISCGLTSTQCLEGYGPNRFSCPLPSSAIDVCDRCREPVIHSHETYECPATCV